MSRRLALWILPVACIVAIAWAVSFRPLPPADFTFSNGTEVESIDPAILSGQPEGRIARGLFEGLCTWDPVTCDPIPGVAESWEISDDGRTYTFRLRENAKWSDGSPVTAEDFRYSMRRFLHPATGGEYVAELWHVVGGENYTSAEVEVGDQVEIELDAPTPSDSPYPFGPGPMLHGVCAKVERSTDGDEVDTRPLYTIEIDGQSRRFQRDPEAEGVEDARWVLPDFEKTVGIRAIDDRTLEVTLNDPCDYFLKLVGFYPLFPVNRRCVETHGPREWTKPENLVCNGPFTLKLRRVRDRIRMEKNPLYWDAEHVRLNTVDVLAVESNTTNLNMYIKGEVDWIIAVPVDVIPDLLKREDKDFDPRPFFSTYYYIFNTTKAPMSDPLVRKALSMALDRGQIVEKVTRAGQQPAFSLVPESIHERIPYVSQKCEPENIERARELLAEAGYPGGDGFPEITILYNTMESHQAIAEMIQSQWKRNLGIDVKLQNKEWGAYLTSRREGDFDIARAGWTGDYIDPVTFLNLLRAKDPNNHSRWNNEKYDGLLRRAAAELDSKKRFQLLEQAERIMMDDQAMLPLYSYRDPNMTRPYVKGWTRNILDTHPLKDIWIDEEMKREVLRREAGR